MFGVAALPMLLPTLVSGAAFPLAVGIDRAAGGAGRSVGDVYSSNTLGAILGSWAAGFLLIPRLGLREGIVLAASLQILMTVVLLLAWKGPRSRAARGAGIAVAAASVVIVALLPDWNRTALTRGGFAVAADLRRYGLTELAVDRSEIVFFEEGITTTVTVRRWSNELTMQMNGVTEASNTGDLSTQVMVGGLGGILHPDPREVLVVGLGSGITAAAAARHPGVESVDCVELSEAVVHAAALFEEANHGVLDDPRVQLIVGDGRNHLSLSGKSFDVIVSQPSNVWVSGTSALMTSEFYGMCRRHLRPGGILCAWIQGYSITSRELRAVLAAVREHFPQVTLWTAGWGDLVIVAGDEGFRLDAQLLLDKAAEHEEIRALLRECDAPDLVSLFSRNLLAGPFLDRYVGEATPNTDDNLILEFQAPKLLYRETVRELFQSLHAAAGGTEQLIVNAPDGLTSAVERGRRARALESQGRLAFREGRGEEGLRLIEEARRLLPGDPAIARVMAQALNGRGETMARHGDAQGALDQYVRASEADPAWGEPVANIARLYLRANRPDPAEAAAADALRLSPGKPDYLVLRAEIRNHTRFHAGARDDARAALVVDPAFHDAFVTLAEALQGLREWDAADSVLAAGLRHHPDSEELRQARDDLEARKRKSDTAARDVPGRWNEFRTRRFDPGLSDEERAAVERLESVGYLGGTREAAAATDRGVVLHDAAEAQPGWNLYTSGDAPAAWLMDMDGNVRHQWRYGFRRIWPDYPVATAQPDAQFWRRVLLLPDGGLIAVFEGLGILRLDRDSELVWANPVRAHHDLQLVPGDELYVLTRESNVDGPHPILEDFVSVLDARDGTEKRRVSVLEAVRSSDLAEVLLQGAHQDGDVLHTNSLQVLDGRAASRVPELAAGNVLVSFRITDAIAALDLKSRRAVWGRRADWSAQHDARVLPDGNLMLFDNGVTREASRVLEMDPRTMNVVWSYEGDADSPFFTNTCGTAQRLENGNTLITESDHGRAFEVTRDGTIVWEFLSPHRTGEDDRYVALLPELRRFSDDAVRGWLPAATPR
jgi:spermidine synthase